MRSLSIKSKIRFKSWLNLLLLLLKHEPASLFFNLLGQEGFPGLVLDNSPVEVALGVEFRGALVQKAQEFLKLRRLASLFGLEERLRHLLRKEVVLAYLVRGLALNLESWTRVLASG